MYTANCNHLSVSPEYLIPPCQLSHSFWAQVPGSYGLVGLVGDEGRVGKIVLLVTLLSCLHVNNNILTEDLGRPACCLV